MAIGDYARMTISGRFTADAKIIKVTDDVNKAVFGAAINRYWKKKGDTESTKSTTFIDCVGWRGLADYIAKFGKKGSKFSAAGSWETETFKANDGKEVTRTQLVLDDINIFNDKGDVPVQKDTNSVPY